MKICKGYRLGYQSYQKLPALVTGKARLDVAYRGELPKLLFYPI